MYHIILNVYYFISYYTSIKLRGEERKKRIKDRKKKGQKEGGRGGIFWHYSNLLHHSQKITRSILPQSTVALARTPRTLSVSTLGSMPQKQWF
jgi:hypothetical protein